MNDGGPAFPQRSVDEDGNLYQRGMTLRDYFAAKAMQGLLASSKYDVDEEATASDAYIIADFMLKARNSDA